MSGEGAAAAEGVAGAAPPVGQEAVPGAEAGAGLPVARQDDDDAGAGPLVVGLRLTAAGLAIAVATVLIAVVSGAGGWWVGGALTLPLLVALLGGRFGGFVPWGLAAAAAGVLVAASRNRLSAPTAAVIGLLLLGYLIVVELADALGSEGSQTHITALAGWVRTLSPVLAAGVAGAIVLAVVVVLPVPPLMIVVVLAPVALVAGVLVTMSRRFGPK